VKIAYHRNAKNPANDETRKRAVEVMSINQLWAVLLAETYAEENREKYAKSRRQLSHEAETTVGKPWDKHEFLIS
jgi:hypothetical protein